MTCRKSHINKCVHRHTTDKKTALCWQVTQSSLSCLFVSLLIALIFIFNTETFSTAFTVLIKHHFPPIKSTKIKRNRCNYTWNMHIPHQPVNTFLLLEWHGYTVQLQFFALADTHWVLIKAKSVLLKLNWVLLTLTLRQNISGTAEMVLRWSFCVKGQTAFVLSTHHVTRVLHPMQKQTEWCFLCEVMSESHTTDFRESAKRNWHL